MEIVILKQEFVSVTIILLKNAILANFQPCLPFLSIDVQIAACLCYIKAQLKVRKLLIKTVEKQLLRIVRVIAK